MIEFGIICVSLGVLLALAFVVALAFVGDAFDWWED